MLPEGIIEVLYDVSELAEADHFIERVKQQLHILRDLRHENIVEFQGWMAQKDGNLFSVVAISRKCEGGEVIGFLHSHKGADHQQLVLGVTVGLNFLHSKKIVHGSLSPRKIFIDCTSERPIAKIGGFDLCHLSETPVYPNEEYWSSLLIRYTAPEVLTGDDVECDMRSDVWSYACTSLEILLGNPPYTSKNIWDDLLIPQAAMDGIPPYERRSLDGFDGVLMSCLEHEPSRRPPIDQVNTQLEGLFLRIRIERELMQEDERNLAKAVQLDQLPVPEGYSASPYPGTYNGGPVCIQQINIPIPPLDDLMRALKRQIRIQRRLIHPNIEQLYGWVLSPETESSISLSLVTTWYPHRDLMGYLRQHPATNRRKMVYHIALGLCYLHSEGVVHADIKPENVVIGDEGNPCLRGFQFTYDRLDELRPSDIPQDLSARFRPPELLQESRKIPDQWSDVWAFGCVGVEILIGESPYSYLPDNQVPIVAANSGRPYEWGDLDGFESTIAECLSHPPENRISMKDVRDTLE
ncbi:kinase-like domain-containing protein [Cantharellus anzutake]|uniref:kinase-like domain-containing protein n=1 Tax=Cantharellus anzutake TaxID=1750568 RepID=UPI0019047BFF|nr:kinase-like domain-containing protein [Cantharellus anzutake]KAF8330011.1 kinase-like domain-containing protein [Cantharellus anzutake]